MMIKLLQDNVLVGTRVHAKGDILDLPDKARKQALVDAGIAEWYQGKAEHDQVEPEEAKEGKGTEAETAALDPASVETTALPAPRSKSKGK